MTSTRSLLLVLAIALACALIPTGTASASSGALRVLVAYSDGAHTEQALKNEIAAQPGVATVDTLDAGSTTPSLTTVRSYDLVLTFSSTDYANPTMLGDELATYADQGGVVVEFAFDWSARAERRLGGRWASAGYSPYNVASAVINLGGTLGTRESSSPLLAGVNGLDTSTHENPLPAPGAVEVAKWADGQSALAFKGHAVGVNACVADACGTSGGDLGRLLVNIAKTRVAGQLVAPDTSCRGDTFFQTGVATGNTYKLPIGVITSWYVQDGPQPTAEVKLRVARRGAGDDITLLGEAPSGVRTAGQVNGPFPARISVSGRDLIGLASIGDGRCAKTTGASGDTWGFPSDNLSATTPTPLLAAAPGTKFPIEAIVEPDDDNDGFGDLTQDHCVAVPGSANGCRSADLSLTLTASAPSVALGHEVAYTVTARNEGPDPAPDVVVTNTLPGASATSSSLGRLEPGQTASVQFATKPSTPGAATDSATIASGADDPNSGNNSASATASVIGPVGPAVVSRLTQTHRTWRRGTTFKFRLDKAASVTLSFTRRGVTRGTLTRAGRAGLNKVHFTGALARKRRLRPGTYNLTLTATTPGIGATSKTLRFTILR
jgi:uncharacterized repeat protein (TIGR01451 family)